MPSKRILSWSKRQSSSEPYYRTGGLLSIEPESNTDFEAKTTLKVEKRRSANLVIFPSDDKQYVSSPITPQSDAAVFGAVTTLQTTSSDMLRSPVPSTIACSKSASVEKPLPRRPRSVSVPSIAELPAELPGSLLLENQGFPSCTTPVSVQPTIQLFRRESHPPDKRLNHGITSLNALDLVPSQLNHTRSVPELSSRYSIMRNIPTGDAIDSLAMAQVGPSAVSNNKSLNKTGMRRRSRPDLITSLSTMDGKVSTNRSGRHDSSQMRQVQEKKVRDQGSEKRQRSSQNEASTATSSSTRSKQIDELKVIITTQNQTNAILQSQFAALKSSHEAQVASLVDAHSAEVASLKDYIRLLQEQDSKRSLHYVSRSDISFVSDSAEPPHTSIRETSPITEDPESVSPIEFENKQRSHRRSESSPEMESLKRKLSATRRPETTTRNLLPELNQYRQNNVALQQQIESLMAKLNESKKGERELRSTLGLTEMRCAEFEDKAAHADKLAKSTQALQNTIDHLESRLEIANTERLDAEEQLSNLMDGKSPFDLNPKGPPSTSHPASDGRMSMSTVFSSASPISSELDSQENETLASFVAHIERLQDQVREKDGRIAKLEKEREQLRRANSKLEQEHKTTAVRPDIDHPDTHMERLRAAILNRESVIEEKDKVICTVQRQLEHHKLLLQAEIRRHAAMKLHMGWEGEDSWPELASIARREDIDRWMDRLHEHLRREQSKQKGKALVDTPDVQMESLRQEIDFYVREIILFKLDIKGYKSDIRKLKKITAPMEAYGRTSDLESEACSLRPTATPVHSSLSPTTPELDGANVVSPVMDEGHIVTALGVSPVAVYPLAASRDRDRVVMAPRNSRELDIPATLYEMAHKNDYATEADLMGSGASSHLVVPRTATCSELIRSFPLPNSAVPHQRIVHKRSMSEPLLGAYQTSHRDHGLIAERVEGRRSASSAHITQTSSANGRAVETSPAPFSPDTNNDATRPSHQSERRHSTTSSPNMPFSISVGPPRKSALTTPFAATMPMSCSITRNAPFSTAWPISRTGIGGTMASTPMTSPVLDIASTCLTPARTYSLAATRQQDQATSSPRTPSHSRNVSGSSVRTVIRT